MGNAYILLLKMDGILAIPAIGVAEFNGIKKKNWNWLIVTCAMYSCLIFWMLSAPLYRYGSMIIPMCSAFLCGPVVGFILKRFQVIEMRGDTLKDGFKLCEEYRDSNLNTYGGIDPYNIFEQ